MDIEHCVIAESIEVAKFRIAADKTLLQRLFNMSCFPPPTLAGFGCLTLQRYNFFPT